MFVVRILFSLLRFTGHLSDRLKVYVGQNEKMPVLSGSPALFWKIARGVANSVDPGETLHSAASHLGLHYLLGPVCPNTYGKVYPLV